jgi:hypothetical protein
MALLLDAARGPGPARPSPEQYTDGRPRKSMNAGIFAASGG